jgi:hypothetical protein
MPVEVRSNEGLGSAEGCSRSERRKVRGCSAPAQGERPEALSGGEAASHVELTVGLAMATTEPQLLNWLAGHRAFGADSQP